MERKRYDLIPGGLVRDNYPSNSESQEVSRGRSSERNFCNGNGAKDRINLSVIKIRIDSIMRKRQR